MEEINNKPKNSNFIKLIIGSKTINDIFLKYFSKLDKSYLINDKDSKIMNFLFNQIFLSKQNSFYFLLRKRQNLITISNEYNANIPQFLRSTKLIIKFINIFMLNMKLFVNIIKVKKIKLERKIYFLIKKLFIKDIISIDDMNIILGYKLIMSIYPEKTDFQSNNISNINNKIKNIEELYFIFDFLTSFTKNKLEDKNKQKFCQVIEQFMKNADSILLNNNINNNFILSKNEHAFQLIELTKISNKLSDSINHFLVRIYKNKFNINYIFNDLSEQFTLQNDEKIENLTNYLITKNLFLNELFLMEEQNENEFSINNGFIFNNDEQNGIICSSFDNRPKNFPNEGFSIVISFCLMNNNPNCKYNIFSFNGIEPNKYLNLYVENNTLKLSLNSTIISESPDIKINKNYVIWIIYPNDKHKEIIFILNNIKKYVSFLEYPSFQYKEILLGVDKNFPFNDKSINNFEGLLGTFIFFNDCLINDKSDNQNESKIMGIKGDYEMLINALNRRKLISIDKNLDLTLNKFTPNITEKIEVIISPKSIGFIQDLNNLNNSYICNYYNYDISIENFKYKFVSNNSITENITYPIEYKKSLLEFLNNHGLIYLHLELYFLMGVLSLKIKEKRSLINDNKENCIHLNEEEIQNMNENINKICLLLFYYMESKIYSNRLDKDNTSLNNFFYTLNDYISIGAKFGFKLKKILLTLIINNLKFLQSNDLLIDKCEFIFIYDNYGIEGKLVFELLFNGLIELIDENENLIENDLWKYLFDKIFHFEKIYLEENISKKAKKDYSKLIQKLLILSLKEKKYDLFELYLGKLEKVINELHLYCIDLQGKNDIFYFDINEGKLQFKEINNKDNKSDEKNVENILDFTKIYNIKLIYKYLKNLFIALDSTETKNNFISFCSEKIEGFIEFFNGLVFFLSQDIDPILNLYNCKNDNENEINKINKKYYSEMIKCLCISFLDIIILEKKTVEKKKSNSFIENYFSKNWTFVSKNKFNFPFFGDNSNKNRSQIIVDKTTENNNLDNYNNNIDDDSLKEDTNYFNLVFKNFEFFKDMSLSKYIFMCLYLLINKSKISNKEFIKLIKNIDNKYNRFELDGQFVFSENDFITNIHYFHLINILIKKNDKDDDNYELIKLCFELYSTLMVKISKFYINNNSVHKDEILGYFFDYKENSIFNIAINNIIKLANEINIEENLDKNIDERRKSYEQFLYMFKENMIKIIDNTLLEFNNPFYFTFIAKCFFYNNLDLDYILGLISIMINKFISYFDECSGQEDMNDKNYLNKMIAIQINNKNLLFLIYKIIFYLVKRKIIVDNIQFIKNIYKFLCFFLNNSKLIYIKILFSIDDNPSSHKKKLIIEIIYEILFEFHIEYILDPKKEYLKCFEDLMCDILNSNNFAKKRLNTIDILESYIPTDKKKKVKSNHSFFYILDKISFKKETKFKVADKVKMDTEILKKIKERIFIKNKNETNEKENTYSICVIFIIKLLIDIDFLFKLLENNKNKVEEISYLKNLLLRTFNILCQDCYKLSKKFINSLNSVGQYDNELYSDFKNFILQEYDNKNILDINKYTDKLLNFASDRKSFSRNIYNYDGIIIPYSFEKFYNNYKSISEKENKTEPSEMSTNYSEEPKIQLPHKTKKIPKRTKTNKKYNLHIISNSNNQLSKKNNLSYIKKFGLKTDIIRIYFSAYFQKMLNYDKGFIIIKKMYKYLFYNEIENIDEFNDYDCPLKIKNYISNKHYSKPFLKKDLNFFESGYLKKSHEFFYNQSKNKEIEKLFTINIFPSKEILFMYDYPNNINFENDKTYYCELLTNHGSIFGKFIILENGLLFLSDCENDKRNNNKYLDYILSTTKFDFLKKQKKIFMDYTEINEIINRTFCFCWTAQEFYMKNGKSYLFNFFKETFKEEIYNLYKSKSKQLKSKIIQNPKDYFIKGDFTKKYKDNNITTYEYLLLLNKFSSRTYNNIGEYPIMPWIIYDKSIRKFDLPMCLQSNKARESYEEKFYKFKEIETDLSHNNHYSNGPYINYYLSRINPFSNEMIKLQGGAFEIPERQFVSVENTILICTKTSNNRESIPEVFELPEIYYNINYNDFGKAKGLTRVHNINVRPYAENGLEFCYYLMEQINYNLEINNNINKWIDFIFGVNQFNSNTNSKEAAFIKFGDETYAQNCDFKKQISELKAQKMDEKKIYSNIKNNIDSPLNFGICPVQILTEATPKKNILNKKQNLNENKDKKEEIQELKKIENNQYTNNIIYFSKNKKINILFGNGLLYVLSQRKKSSNEYDVSTEIKTKGLLLPNLIGKYTYCEIKENFYIFCGFFDKTLKFYQNNKNEFNYLLEIYTTSILSIDEREFITGHSNGKLIKWELIPVSNNNQTDYKFKKAIEIKSNKSAIFCIEYEEKLNIILVCDNNSIIIRNYYNLEFLTCIKIKENNSQINKILKVKVFNNFLIYALVKLKGNNSYELHCYSLNGAFHKKIEGNFHDFLIIKNGNIITNDLDNNQIVVYKGCNMNQLYIKDIEHTNQNIKDFSFDYENPNIIYLCRKDNKSTYIQKFLMDQLIENNATINNK